MQNEILLREIKSDLEKNFSRQIQKVILFGSRINETAREYSDYDVLIITHKTIDWEVKDRILDVISDINVRNDIMIDVHIISEPELETIKGKQPFIENAIETGISV